MTIDSSKVAALIYSAIENKYSAVEIGNLRSIVDETLKRLNSLSDKRAIYAAIEPTHDLRSDIANQTTCCFFIERFWKCDERIPTAEEVHAVTCGAQASQNQLRDAEYVADYGTVPTPLDAVPRELSILNGRIASVDALGTSSPVEKGAYLAIVLGTIIRVHPFRDGNGRTGRMLIEYLLRRWGHDFIVLPKVRNDPVWKEALARAVSGDHAMLGRFLADRIAPNP